MKLTRIIALTNLVLLIGLTAACQTKDKNFYFNNFKKIYPFLNNYSWTVDYGGPDGGGGSDVKAHTKLNDTTFQVILRSTFDHTGKDVFNVDAGKIYVKNDTTYYRSLDSALKTRYEYMSFSTGERIFTLGKYLFMSEHDQLSRRQQEYYRRHLDSLRLIKGDNLPPLPEEPE